MAEKGLQVILLSQTETLEPLVAMAAKLCYSPADLLKLLEKNSGQDQKDFINRLMSSGHQSPLEHISFTFGIEGISRACSHQLVRHRIASFSQQSQRYVSEASSGVAGKIFDFIIPSSIKNLGVADTAEFEEQMRVIQGFYDYWIERFAQELGKQGEKANEDARFVLPNAAETKIITTMNARQLLHFFAVRCCNRAQWEIRAMAKEMFKLALAKAPTIFWQAGPVCRRGPCPEGKMTCGRPAEMREEYQLISESVVQPLFQQIAERAKNDKILKEMKSYANTKYISR